MSRCLNLMRGESTIRPAVLVEYMKEWGAERVVGDVRLKYGHPPNSNANYMWIIEDDLVDCIIACPPQLFFTTQIPVCLWFVAKNKTDKRYRQHRGETLFIDARKLFAKISRVQNEFSEEHIAKIAGTYHAWRGEDIKSHHPSGEKIESSLSYGGENTNSPLPNGGEGQASPERSRRGEGAYTYQDIPGFCKSATLEEIRSHGYVLTPGRYVGTEEIEDDGVPFEEKMVRLSAELAEQFEESKELQKKIKANLKELGFEP